MHPFRLKWVQRATTLGRMFRRALRYPRSRWRDVRQFRSESRDVARARMREISAETFNEMLSSSISSRQPLLVVRPGGAEGGVLQHFLSQRVDRGSQPPRPYPPRVLAAGEVNVGIVPRTAQAFDRFSLDYLAALQASDVLVHFSWTAWMAGLAMCESSVTMEYERFDPFSQLDGGTRPWTHDLEGKTVLVVAPFKESIEHQYPRRSQISIVNELLPDFDLAVIEPPVTFAGLGKGADWFQELERTTSEMSKVDFDVAIVGAGSYGPAIARHAKELGRVGIHLGGAVQLLFGIMGKRWEGENFYPQYQPLQGWIRPSPAETPQQAELVEGGCYW